MLSSSSPHPAETADEFKRNMKTKTNPQNNCFILRLSKFQMKNLFLKFQQYASLVFMQQYHKLLIGHEFIDYEDIFQREGYQLFCFYLKNRMMSLMSHQPPCIEIMDIQCFVLRTKTLSIVRIPTIYVWMYLNNANSLH